MSNELSKEEWERFKQLTSELKELMDLNEALVSEGLVEDPFDMFLRFIEKVVSFGRGLPCSDSSEMISFKQDVDTFSDSLRSLFDHIKKRADKGYIFRVYPLRRLTTVLEEYERLASIAKELELDFPILSEGLIKKLVPVM